MLGILFLPKLSFEQTTWYTDPSKNTSANGDSLYFPNLASLDYTVVKCSGCSSSSSGPFSNQTIAASDNIIVQNGSWLSVGASPSAGGAIHALPCNNFTLNGTLNRQTGGSYVAFSGLFSGTGIVRTAGCIGNNSNSSTINFQSATPLDAFIGGLYLYYDLTLTGNTDMYTPQTSTTASLRSGGSITFRTAGVKLKLNGYNLSLGSILTSSVGYISSNSSSNLIVRAGYSSGTPTANSASAQLYFDLTTPGTTNVINSITCSGSARIYTPVIITGYVNNLYNGSGASKFVLNEPGTLTDGTTTRGMVTLASTASGTAYISSTGGGLYYDILTAGTTFPTYNIQQYLSAKRGWRLLGSPDKNAITLSTFATNSNIDINNGTNTTPTVYNYDGTQTTDPWVANTSGTWSPNKGLLLFVRGKSGEGIGGGVYTPSNVTITDTGCTLQQGTQTPIALTYDASNSNMKWNVISNPYPAPVSAKAITGLYGNANINQSIYYFNPNKGGGAASTANGDYEFVTLSGSQDFIIPSFGAILVQTQAAGQSITFSESSKSTSAGSTSLFSIDNSKKIELQLFAEGNADFVDRLQIRFDAGSTNASNDHWDLTKQSMSGDYQLYTLSKEEQKLAIDSRAALNAALTIGLETTQQTNFTIKVSDYHVAQGVSLFLKDKLLNTLTELKQDATYTFSVTADAKTQGNKRFEIVTQQVLVTQNLGN